MSFVDALYWPNIDVDKVEEMIKNRESIEMPVCPYCERITFTDEDEYKCCEQSIEKNPPSIVTLEPLDIVDREIYGSFKYDEG